MLLPPFKQQSKDAVKHQKTTFYYTFTVYQEETTLSSHGCEQIVNILQKALVVEAHLKVLKQVAYY